MRKNKFCMILLFLLLFEGSVFFSFSGYRTYADDEKWRWPPPCCLWLKKEIPPVLFSEFAPANPIEYKILGRVTNIQTSNISIDVLAIIKKAAVINLRKKDIVLNFEGSVNINDFKANEYILLIPTKAYNTYLNREMYDFTKIPKEMIK